VRLFTRLFRCIPIWRGQVDRDALRAVVGALQAGQVIAIFPEGGVNPELAELVARGEQIPEVQGNLSRVNPQLIKGRTGVAWVAVMSQARILPVALLGTEQIAGGLSKFQRTAVTIRLGPIFGPLSVEAELKGAARRRRLDELTDGMMQQIAALCPPKQRGHYSAVAPKGNAEKG
jgi:1-acyl-sn-glycerol-3-phosphate acyltransferase